MASPPPHGSADATAWTADWGQSQALSERALRWLGCAEAATVLLAQPERERKGRERTGMPQRARGELSRLAKRLAAQGQVLPKWNIVTGDKVAVLAGKEKGKQGVVTKVVRRENRLFVKGLNFHKKAVKTRDQENPGGILEREAPLHYSNVQLLDPATVTTEWPAQPGVPTRFHIGWDSTGRQVRVAKRSGLVIEKPVHEPRLKKYTGKWTPWSHFAATVTREGTG